MAEVAQVEAPPVPGKIAGEVARGVTTGEAGILLTKMGELSVPAIDVVAGEKVPPGTRDSLFLQLFGETDVTKVDKSLRPLATQLDSLLTSLAKNVDATTAVPSEINAAIEQVVLQTDGWSELYKNMNAAQRSQFLKGIRDSGVIPLARKEFIDKAVGVEGNKYAASATKYKEISSDLNDRKNEQKSVNTKIGGKDRAKVLSDKEAKSREIEDLKGQKQTMQERKAQLEERQARRTGEYIAAKKTGADLTAALAADPDYQKWQTDINGIDTKLNDTTPTGIDGKIKTAESALRKLEETEEAFKRNDQLTKEIDSLSKEVRDAQADMLSSRSGLVKQLNELLKSLNGVMPEAAKQALNKFKIRLEQANTEIAKDKAKDAAKEGDIMKGAEANFIVYLNDVRYTITRQRSSSRLVDILRGGKQVGVKETNESLIRADFDGLFTPDGRGSANLVLNQINTAIATGSGSGLSPEQIKYFRAHPEAKAKFVENVRSEAFKTVSKKAVMHLKLTEADLTTLSSSNDFAVAFEQGVGGAEKARQLIERASGAKIKGGTIKENLEKLAKPVLLGLILLALFFSIKSLTGH